MSGLLDRWQLALEPFGCGQQAALRSCLIGSLAARLERHPDGSDLWREAMDDALSLMQEATR